LETGINTLVVRDKIQITSPVSGGELQNPQPWADGFRYEVRGTLKLLPKGHEIWLLNAGQDGESAKQWPQAIANRNTTSGEWQGRIYLQKWNTETFINAVVAPPTAQQLFRYYQQMVGAKNH
jgi:hypothetical protein